MVSQKYDTEFLFPPKPARIFENATLFLMYGLRSTSTSSICEKQYLLPEMVYSIMLKVQRVFLFGSIQKVFFYYPKGGVHNSSFNSKGYLFLRVFILEKMDAIRDLFFRNGIKNKMMCFLGGLLFFFVNIICYFFVGKCKFKIGTTFV